MTIGQQIHNYYKIPFKLPTNFETIPNVKLTASWQEDILSRYNPFLETKELKASDNITQTFLKLRAAHNFRHDFNLEHNK